MKPSRRSSPTPPQSDSLRVAAPASNQVSVSEGLDSPTPATPAINHLSAEDVALRAYQSWERSGGQHGNDQAHWYAAEQEMRNQPGAPARDEEGNLPDPETRREMP